MSFASGYVPKAGGANQLTLYSKQTASKVPEGMTLGEDFPMVCEPCLGDNPYVRMIRKPNDRMCKISHRPFTSFRWKAGSGGRFKETIVSYEVAAEKNICQACLCDMDYGLPVGIRDAFLAASQKDDSLAPVSEVNQQYYYQQKAAELAQGGGPSGDSSQGLLKLAREFNKPKSAGAQFKNLPGLCFSWVNGKCTRVVEKNCPFRPCCGAFAFPEIATSNPTLHQQLLDQLREKGPAQVMRTLEHGTRNTLRQASRKSNSNNNSKRGQAAGNKGQFANRDAEENKVSTLYLTGVPEDVQEGDITTAMYSYGEIKKIHMLKSKKCAFVEFTTREAAELAVSGTGGRCSIRGQQAKVGFAMTKKKKSKKNNRDSGNAGDSASATGTGPAHKKMKPAPPAPVNATAELAKSTPVPAGLKAFVNPAAIAAAARGAVSVPSIQPMKTKKGNTFYPSMSSAGGSGEGDQVT